MKKSIFLLGVAVAAMTSCSNDELLEQIQPVQKAIGFESWVNKPTKAVNDVTEGTLKEFYVFGYFTKGNATENVFDNIAVLKTDVTGHNGWDVQENELWTNNAYSFAAYANGNGTGEEETPEGDKLNNVTFEQDELTITGYSLGDKDILAAFSKVDAIQNTEVENRQEVSMTFGHLLSKVSFKFTYAEAKENIKVQITNIKLNVPLTATCTATSSETEWTNHTGSKEYSFTDEDESKFEAITYANSANIKLSEEFYVLPNKIEGAVLTFTATYMDTTQDDAVVREKTYNLPLSNGTVNDGDYDWIANNVYQYNVSLPDSPLYIDFTVGGITDWNTPANIVDITPNDAPIGE